VERLHLTQIIFTEHLQVMVLSSYLVDQLQQTSYALQVAAAAVDSSTRPAVVLADYFITRRQL
jgi:hypothetical protein